MNPPLTIADTQNGLKNKEFSVVELVDSYLNRINHFDGQINSFITVSDDVAYSQAKEADRLFKNNPANVFDEFPLLGVCVSHKDMFLTKGIRTTAASNVLRDYVPQYSASVVNRYDKAGAVTLGKLNCDAWAHGSSGENSDFGSTKNPYNYSYVPGGSSSGSAAAMAANFTLISSGTDTCGSIRLPASYCGIYGLKPTYGSVSRYGVIAMASSLDSIGHFGRSIDDVERVFNITKGEDGLDSTVKNACPSQKKDKYKIGIPKEFFTDGVDIEVEENVNKAIEVFEKAGVEIVEVSIPHMKYAISVYYIIQPAEVSSNLGRYDGIRFGNKRDMFGAEAKRRIMLGSYVLSSGYYDAYYLKAMKVRSVIVREVDNVFTKVDAMIAPVSPTAAFKLGAKTDNPLEMYLTDIYAGVANLSGIPGLSIPFNKSKLGLPLGFQLMSARFDEPTLFQLAKMFEVVTEYKPSVAILE